MNKLLNVKSFINNLLGLLNNERLEARIQENRKWIEGAEKFEGKIMKKEEMIDSFKQRIKYLERKKEF